MLRSVVGAALAFSLALYVGCAPEDAATPADSAVTPDSTTTPPDNSSNAATPAEESAAASDPAAVDDPLTSNGSRTTDSQPSGDASEDRSEPASDETDNSDSSNSEPSEEPGSLRTALGEPLEPDAEGVYEIIFEDIQLPIQADVVFRPFMLTDRVKALDGQRIRINGYMLPDSKTRGITQFVLLKNTECKFGPGGQADHLINVLMVDGVTARFRDTPITIEGVLKINPFRGPDGNTWSIYDLACDQIESYEPRR